MKRIEELGISPWPWSAEIGADDRFVIRDSEGHEIAQAFSGGYDSTIMSAAPELYDALRDAIIEMCHDCPNCTGYPKYGCKNQACECFPAEWRAALAKAAGEEVTK